MNKTRSQPSIRARLNLLLATALAFAFGLGLASALDLTPFTIAADDRTPPNLVIGAPGDAAVTMNGGFADVIERVAPAVVTVFAEGERQIARGFPDFPLPPGFEDLDPRNRKPEEPQTQLVPWSGSGFIVSGDGYVLTNNHVVAGATRIDLELADQRRFEDVEVVGRDPQTDVALLKIDAEDLPVMPLGSSESTRVGEWVLAIGSPGLGGLGGPLETTVTAGIVSAKGRNIRILSQQNQLAIEDFIQTDAVINRGNSGGPLVNAAGEVIGINTAIASTTGTYQGYGFAVPIELARDVIDDLIEFGEVRRALIGVGINNVNAADAKFYGLDRVAGAKVGSFSFENSPARLAGIEIGDVIVGVEGEPIQGVSDLQRKIRAYDPGETVTLDVVRRSTKKHESVRVKLIAADEMPGAETAAGSGRRERGAFDDPLGIEISEIDRAERRQYDIPPATEGVVITDVDPRGPLGRQMGSLAEGAVIVDVNGRKIESIEDYERAVADLGPGDVASLIVRWRTQDGTWQNQIVSMVLPER